MLCMLLYTKLNVINSRHYPQALATQIHSFITRHMYGITIVIQLKSPLASRPLPLSPHRLLLVLPSAAVTAEDHSCSLLLPSALAATKMLQSTSNPLPAASSAGK